VYAEYRTGDKITLQAEEHTAEELLYKLMYKRHDIENQLEWAEANTLLTLEEEALMVGGAKKQEEGGGKKGASKGKGPPKGKPPPKKK